MCINKTLDHIGMILALNHIFASDEIPMNSVADFSPFTIGKNHKACAFCLALCFLFFLPYLLSAQDHLRISYSQNDGVPDFLNVCGEADTIRLIVQAKGSVNTPRTNIHARLNPFAGVQVVSLLNSSSAGVEWINTNPRSPEFLLPDIADNTVRLDLAIKAGCAYLDTLQANEQLRVFDTWNLTYDLASTTDISETENTAEYRDAFAVPFFTLELEPRAGPVRQNSCFDRVITITNTALNGYADTLIYENIQEIGAEITRLSANGLDVPFTRTPVDANRVRIRAVLERTVFNENKNPDGGTTNSDGNFGPDEVLTLTETVCIQSCFLPLGSHHSIAWGCEGQYCNTNQITDVINLGQGEANVQVQTSGSIPNQNAGYCTAGVTTLTFTNNGTEVDPGFGAMYDIATGIGLGGDFLLSQNGYTITRMVIGTVDLPHFNGFNELEQHPEFRSDPDGPGGLTDVDGDGYYDDLPIGQQIEVTAYYEFDCSRAASFNTADSCFNNFSTSFNARLDYTNACDERLVRLESSYLRPTNNNSGVENFHQPDAFLETDIFYVRHIENRSVRTFDAACSNAQFLATVILPEGVNPVLDSIFLIKNGASAFQLQSANRNGDTLVLRYDANLSPFLTGAYELQLAFRADCSTALGPTVFPITFEYDCSDCDCRHLWYCDEVRGPWLHATNPPCPQPVLIDCQVGLQTTDFEVQRTTFGYSDRDFTQPFPPDLAKRKVAISCDTVRMRVANTIGKNQLTDSIGVVIEHGNIDGTNSAIPTFLFGNGQVKFVHGDSATFCDILPQEVLWDPGKNHFRINLGRYLNESGIPLSPGDSVVFIGKFSVNPDGPFLFQFRSIPDFRAYGYAVLLGQEFSCDSFGETFTLGKTNTVFDFPASLSFPKGCQPALLEYKLITVNNGFKDFFGDEFRPGASVDELRFDFDPNLLTAFEAATVEVSIPGHPIYGNNFYALPPLKDFPDGNYIVRFDTLDHVPNLNDFQNYSFNARIRLEPTCRSYTGSSSGNNRYRLNAAIQFMDRVYAADFGDGSCAEQRTESIQQDIAYENVPQLSFIPRSTTNFILTGDTALWTVELCNNATTASAGATWFALESPDAAVEVIAMTDISNRDNPVALSLHDYGVDGRHSFVLAPGLSPATAQNPRSSYCHLIQIKAIVKKCGESLLDVRAGWNCQAFDAAVWNPGLYPPCTDLSIPLTVSTRDPFLEAAIIDQPTVFPDICDTSEVTILLKNIDLGAVFDLQTQFIIPGIGATLIRDGVEIAYPASADFQPAIAAPEYVETNLQGQVYAYDGFSGLNEFLFNEGLPGFNPDSPGDSNTLKLKFRYITSCDFESGSLAYFTFQGKKGCGALSNYEAGETFPLYIKDIEPDTSKIFQVAFGPDSRLVNGRSVLDIFITNLTGTPSDSSDIISLTLPEGVQYIVGSARGILPQNWSPGLPEFELVGNLQKLTWPLPPGLGKADTAWLQILVEAPGYTCQDDPAQVRLMTLTRNSKFCDIQNEVCEINLITASSGDALTALRVGATLDISFDNVESRCDALGEFLEVTTTLTTVGFNFAGERLRYNFFFDENINGTREANERILFSDSVVAPTGGTSLQFLSNFFAEVNQVCRIGLEADTAGLPICEPVFASLPTPNLLNAGQDQTICSRNGTALTTIGSDSCPDYQYSWTARTPAIANHIRNLTNPSTLVEIPEPPDGAVTYQYILETDRGFGCTNTFDTVAITTGPELSLELGDDFYLATGDSVQLFPDITGGVSPVNFDWMPHNGLDSNHIRLPTASPLADTRYILNISDSLNCTATDDIWVFVRIPVSAGVSFSDTAICETSRVRLLATGGDIFNWKEHSDNPTTGNLNAYSVANPLFADGQPGATYQYQVIVGSNDFPGNEDTVAVAITVNPLPKVYAGRDALLCTGDTTTLNAQTTGLGGFSYLWSTGDTVAKPEIVPDATRLYSVTVTDSNGCSADADVRIELVDCACDPPLIKNILTENTNCGEQLGQATVITAAPAADFSYSWMPDTGEPNAIGNGRSGLPYGGYRVRISRRADPDCFTIVFIMINNADGPQATVQSTPATCNDSNGGAQLSPDNYSYEWPDGSTAANRDDLVAGTYFVTVTAPRDTACKNVVRVDVARDNNLTATVQINQLPGCETRNGSVTLDVSGGSGDYDYSWTGGAATRDDLSAGTYILTITDTQSGCSLPFSFSLPANNSPATISISNVWPPRCIGQADGRLDFDINYQTGFDFPADTIITDGIRHFQNGSLTAGTYCIEVRDAAGCLMASQCATLELRSPLSAGITVTPVCEGLGAVTMDITGGTTPYTVDWKHIPGTNDGTDLVDVAVDTFDFTISDSLGCILEGQVLVDSCSRCFIFPTIDTFLLQADNCDGTAGFCIPRDFQTVTELKIFDNGQLYAGDFQPCDVDTVGIYSFQNLFGQGNIGPYRMIDWQVNGQSLSGNFSNLADLVRLMNQLDPGGSWQLYAAATAITGGNNLTSYGAMTLQDINFGITSVHNFASVFPPNGFAIAVGPGFHQIILENEARNCMDTVFLDVVCTSVDTIGITMQTDRTDTLCLSANELTGPPETIWNKCPDIPVADISFLNDSCVIIRALVPGEDTTCIVLCDSLGICDTTILIVEILPPPGPGKIVSDTISVGQTRRICCDTSELNIEGPVASIQNLCPENADSSVFFELSRDPFCVSYTGLAEGTNTACIAFCDSMGHCDTIPFNITVLPTQIIYDTIYLQSDTVEYCFDILQLPGDAFRISNDCPASGGEAVIFRLNNNALCMTYTGIALGQDTACIIFSDNLGNEIRTTFITTVVTTTPETVCDTIYINETIKFCPDTSELANGNIRFFDNFCPGESAGLVDFFLDFNTYCIEYTGYETGKDSACIVICDDTGVCDTTYFCITVVEYGDPAVANADCDTTDRGIPVVINISKNDTLFGNVDCATIIDAPNYGVVTVNPDCSVTYQPDDEFCERTDFFIYEVCNENGCDTALVKVFIRCVDITVFTAVSPNRDGINDVFYISGLEDKPDNLLQIYNRWGNLVFEQANYQNTWNGTWNGQDLPDGTYYYVLKVNDNGDERIFRGYIELFR